MTYSVFGGTLNFAQSNPLLLSESNSRSTNTNLALTKPLSHHPCLSWNCSHKTTLSIRLSTEFKNSCTSPPHQRLTSWEEIGIKIMLIFYVSTTDGFRKLVTQYQRHNCSNNDIQWDTNV